MKPFKFTPATDSHVLPILPTVRGCRLLICLHSALIATRCAFIAIPLVFSLNIRLDNSPIGFHNTSVSLLWAQSDPSDFVLSAFLIHTKESVMVAKTMQPVENFAANRTTYMTFNYTSLPGNRDCILLAWLPDSKYISDIFRHVPLSMFMSYSSAGQHFAQSQVFSVTDPEATTSSTLISFGISTTSSVPGCVPPRLALGFESETNNFP